MNQAKRQVLIVDDSADDMHVLMENLRQEYAVLAATSGEKGLQLASREPRPDAILLDVSMPGMDGYETCRRLKADPESREIDVIFVSAHDDVDEKLAGYEAGGSDYLIKPVQPVELLEKVKNAIRSRDIRSEAESEKRVAMQTAMTAISSAGEQGVVLDFMRRSFSAGSIGDLARLIVDATRSYGLENSVQIRGSWGAVNASTADPMPRLEQELLARLKDVGRLRERGENFVANFGGITQLIKNMPEDEERRGRLRDHLAVLLEGAEARLQALELDQELAKVVQHSNRALQQVQAMQRAQKEAAMRIMDGVMEDLQDTFNSYGLTEEQENELAQVVQTGVDRSLENFEHGLRVDEELRGIVDRLGRLA